MYKRTTKKGESMSDTDLHQNINDLFFHKEKEPKRKLKSKVQSTIELLNNSTVVKEYHTRQVANEQMPTELQNYSRNLSRNQRINFEIDEYLDALIMESMITEPFRPFFAKACHALGMDTVTRLKLNARRGKEPQRLFSYLVKGAIVAKYKREFEAL